MVTPLDPGLPVYALGAWAGNVMDDAGVRWAVTEESGWSSSPALRYQAETRQNGHGAANGPMYASERVITLAGNALAPSRTAMLQARDFVIGEVAAGRQRMEVAEQHATRWAMVTPSDAVRTTDRGARSFDWQMVLSAADPRKYDPEMSLSTGLPTGSGGLTYPLTYPLEYGAQGITGRVDMNNPGSAETFPRFRINGPLPDFELRAIEAGRSLRYTEPLGESEYVLLNALTGSVLLNGQSTRRNALTVAQWFGIPRRGSTSVQFSTSGTYSAAAQMTATWAPAHW